MKYRISLILLVLFIVSLSAREINSYRLDDGTYRYSCLGKEEISGLLGIAPERIHKESSTKMSDAEIIRFFGSRGYRNYKSIGIINPTKKDLESIRRGKVPGVTPRLEGDPMTSMIYSYSINRKLDPAFVMALIKAESNFNPQAVSHAGAVGLMQIMPATASMVARQEITPDQLKNPIINLHIGTYHLRDLIVRYRCPITVLSAWNAGEGAVQRYGSVPPFPETINFGATVMNNYRNYKKDR